MDQTEVVKTDKMREVERRRLGGKCVREFIVASLNAGESKTDIAKRLGISFQALAGSKTCWLVRLGINTKPFVVVE